MKIIRFFLLSALAVTAFAPTGFAQKLTVGDIVAFHLDSIGTGEQRRAGKNRLAAGTSEMIQKIPHRRLAGKALIVSEASNLFFLASFNSPDYRLERIGYFYKKIEIPFITAGSRSPLGGYLLDNNVILSEGLFTGSLSSNWSLLDLEARGARLEKAGKKKIGGREAYVLQYYPKGGVSADFSIKLFFDAENFRHLRSEYLYTLVARDAKAGKLGGNMDGGRKYLLIEDFGDFREESGLTLPHSYKIYLMMDAQQQTGTVEFEWNIAIQKYIFDQKLNADFFSFEEK